jgi:hypothetical protein
MARGLVLVAFVALATWTRAAAAEETTGVWPNVGVPSEATGDGADDVAVVVGIDHYDDLPRVKGASDNARDWEKWLLFGRHLKIENVTLLTDKQATIDVVEQRLKEAVAKTTEKSTLYFVFIGHGAPAKSGRDGVLIGSDARAVEASLYSRSLPQSRLVELVEQGKQAHSIVAIDACFNGRGQDGDALLKGTQATPPSSLVPPTKATVLSSSALHEYSGALPGGERPAFSYLLLGAMRGWGDTNKDGVVTAKESVAYAGIVLRTLPNNHEQHPSLSGPDEDVELSKNAKEPPPDLFELRKKVIAWKPPAPPKGPELRVTARCMSPDALTPDDGLYVSVDHVAVQASAVDSGPDGKTRSISFLVPAGQHTVRVGSARCKGSETTGYFRDGEATVVDTTLESNDGLLDRAPFGKPNGWSLRVAGGFEAAFGNMIGYNSTSFGSGLQTTARYDKPSWAYMSVEVALRPRFLSAGVGFDFGVGTNTFALYQRGDATGYRDVKIFDSVGAMTMYGPKVFFGPKVPFGRISWNIGEIVGGVRFFSFPAGRADTVSSNMFALSLGGRMGLDVALLCDLHVGGYGGFNYQADPFGGGTLTKPAINETVSAYGQAAITFQPSSECRRERQAGDPSMSIRQAAGAR